MTKGKATMTANNDVNSYGVESIQIHRGLDGIRKRPSMYLGENGDSMVFQMIKEIVDNSIDESQAGRNSHVSVTVNLKTMEVIVYDKGHGVPTGMNQKENINTLTAVFALVHAGGKFDDKAYSSSAGTFGTGSSAVNAVSDKFSVWTYWKGVWYSQKFEKGKQVTKVLSNSKVPGSLSERVIDFSDKGTLIYFKPDLSVVSESASRLAKIDIHRIRDYLKTASYLNPKLSLFLRSESHNKTVKFYTNKGLADLVQDRIESESLTYLTTKKLDFSDKTMSLSMAWTDSDSDEGLWSYVNGSRTVDGGKHLEGLYTAYQKALVFFANDSADKDVSQAEAKKPKVLIKQRNKKVKKTRLQVSIDKVSLKDLKVGIVGVFNFKMSGAAYSSQTKERLSSNVSKPVETVLYTAFVDFFTANPVAVKAIINKAKTVAQGREQFRQSVRSLTSMKKSGALFLPNILASAPDATPDTRSLYVVEGDSAAGCFHGETLILLEDMTVKSMRELTLDSCYKHIQSNGVAYDLNTGKPVFFPIDSPRITKYVSELLEVRLSNRTTFICTEDHLILTQERYDNVYVRADSLAKGTQLRTTYSDTIIRVNELCKISYGFPVPVYDLTSLQHQNFSLYNGVVVHNSAKKARDSSFQEVLALTGKVVNAARTKITQVLSSEPVKNLIMSLGVDVSQIAQDSIVDLSSTSQRKKSKVVDESLASADSKKLKRPVDILPAKDLRVKDIYVLADQDPDGYHIAVLVLTTLWKFLPSLFYQGRVWVVSAKLYHAHHNNKFYFGDTFDDCYSQMPSNAPKNSVIRAKGLAEYNPIVLKYIAFDPSTRSVLRILPPKSQDAAEYFEKMVGPDSNERKLLLGL